MAATASAAPADRACVESGQWSEPVAFDLTRTENRVSVPKKEQDAVPKRAGVYAICAKASSKDTRDLILDIGECGPRPSSGDGLRGRLASKVDHSASEKIAEDIRNGEIQDPLYVVWATAASKTEAKEAQDALICLFRREFGKQPKYNRETERSSSPDDHSRLYENLKSLAGDNAGTARISGGSPPLTRRRERAIDRIARKLRTLSTERVGEVEDFVDFLNRRDDERATTEMALAASAPVLTAIWDNPEDGEYDSL